MLATDSQLSLPLQFIARFLTQEDVKNHGPQNSMGMYYLGLSKTSCESPNLPNLK